MKGKNYDKEVHTGAIAIEASQDEVGKGKGPDESPSNAAAFAKAICGARVVTTQ